MAWQMLAKGYRNRHVGETAMNRSVIPWNGTGMTE
jgi:hypothetical protein